jgi:hypothetical protein
MNVPSIESISLSIASVAIGLHSHFRILYVQLRDTRSLSQKRLGMKIYTVSVVRVSVLCSPKVQSFADKASLRAVECTHTIQGLFTPKQARHR